MDWGCPQWRQWSFRRCWAFCCRCLVAVAASRPAFSASWRKRRVSPPPYDVPPPRGGDVLSPPRQRSRWRTASGAAARSRPRRPPERRAAAGRAVEEWESSRLLIAEAGWARFFQGQGRHLGFGTVPAELKKEKSLCAELFSSSSRTAVQSLKLRQKKN